MPERGKGAPTQDDWYRKLKEKSFEARVYKERPKPEEIKEEAQAIAEKELELQGASDDSLNKSAKEDSNNLRAVLEEVAISGNAEKLKGAIYEKWTSEDVDKLLKSINDAKKEIGGEAGISRYVGSSPEKTLDILRKIGENPTQELGQAGIEEIEEEIGNLEMFIWELEGILSNKEGNKRDKYQYKDWTGDDFENVLSEAKRVFEDLESQIDSIKEYF